mgnify:CR=1 FL=1
MTNNVLNSLDDIKNIIISLQAELKSKTNEYILLSKKNTELEDEIRNLSKVSLVAGLTRQVDEKNHTIKLLEKQIDNFKKSKISPNKLTVEDTFKKSSNKLIVEDSEDDEIKVEDGFELITHRDKQLLKDIDTRKLYFITTKGSKGQYAGKESKKGKIKLNE